MILGSPAKEHNPGPEVQTDDQIGGEHDCYHRYYSFSVSCNRLVEELSDNHISRVDVNPH